VSVLIRSQPLRGFDQDMAERIVSHMRTIGVDVCRQAGVSCVSKDAATGRLRVTLTSEGVEEERVVDTVLFATGRSPQTKGLGLEECGVKLSAAGKIEVDACDRTSVPHIYAIGDVATGAPELTPVAVKAGQLLAERLYNKGTEIMSQQYIPTTVFTPLEYSSIGMTESMATQLYKDDVEVYHGHLSPLEWSLAYLDPNTCYAKMVVRKSTDVVVGFHLLAPNAGEIAQMAAVAMNCGARKLDFDRTIGIHPTTAEGLTTLTVTKSSGESPAKKGC
jgi:pyruvate/2-oxoglutarate dehydrogenase complex dihydrolipoamide dehydrogenase (E3) component